MALYRQDKTAAKAGQIARVGESLSRATGEANTGATDVLAGHFVAVAPVGIKAVSDPKDTILGVVVASLIQGVYRTNDYLSVGRIGNGDAIWVVSSDATLVRGDSVFIVTKDTETAKAGTVVKTAITSNTIATNYIVEQVADGLVMISRKEA